jgi:ABC-2 type transport system permease protein
MFKLWAAIVKDFRILTRDKVGLLLMLAMPILLAVVVTGIQNSTFDLVNNKKIPMLLCNRDTGESSRQLEDALRKIGMFDLKKADTNLSDAAIRRAVEKHDVLIAIIIPNDFSDKIKSKAEIISQKALSEFGVDDNVSNTPVISDSTEPITMLYHPVLQESFRFSAQSALRSAMQIVESKAILQSLYFSLNKSVIPPSLEDDITNNQAAIREIAVSKSGSAKLPNATQHNIPAWTVFAMFFIIVSLGGSVVREKLSGSFVRMKTLPTNYLIALTAKQIAYIIVTLVQVAVIFSMGVYLFPLLGFPTLNMPEDLLGLTIVSLICGWCAVSYAVAVGIFAKTQEQANGFGAVSVVILAALGGILVPVFVMPDALQIIMKFSPLYWCLKSYYGLFLEEGNLHDILFSIMPLLVITFAIQIIIFAGLRKQRLI